MTIPRQLAPTVGLSHDGFKFLEGNFEGIKGYAVGRMTKSRRGKLYIVDVEVAASALGHPAHGVSLDPFEVALSELVTIVR